LRLIVYAALFAAIVSRIVYVRAFKRVQLTQPEAATRNPRVKMRAGGRVILSKQARS
jgi:hypothetical protein